MNKADIIIQDIRFYVDKAIESGDKSIREYYDDEVQRLMTKLLLTLYHEESDRIEGGKAV